MNAPSEQPPSTLGQHLLAAAQQDHSWVVRVAEEERTLSTEQVVAAYNEHAIDGETFVWTEGMQDWQPLEDVDTLVDALHEAAARRSASGSATDEATVLAPSYPPQVATIASQQAVRHHASGGNISRRRMFFFPAEKPEKPLHLEKSGPSPL